MTAQQETWQFCTHKKVKYVAESTSWKKFQAADITLLNFHGAGVPPEVTKTETEVFAARLDNWLLALHFASREGARYAVRAVVGDSSKKMQDLLDVVGQYYV